VQNARKPALDYREYYHLESYLFDTVNPRFAKQGYLGALDFFCIVIWKAERAKSRIAKTLQESGHDLDTACSLLTQGIAREASAENRLRTLVQKGIRLPMASAILTVLYPEEFTVYDKRVCDILGEFHRLKNVTNFERLWLGYQDFKRKVEATAPLELSLRDKDRYLWGKTFHERLRTDVEQGFKRPKAKKAKPSDDK